jgi:hypothetical protein
MNPSTKQTENLTQCGNKTKPLLSSRIFFATLESEDGERTLKQHGYTEAMRGAWYADKYEGNKQLCNKKGGIHDGDKFVSMDEINSEGIDRDKCCKKCLKIYDLQHGL